MIPRKSHPLDYLIEGLVQRKLHFEEEDFKGLLFERACQELEVEGNALERNAISTKMCRYAADVLLTMDDIYQDYDRDVWLKKDDTGCYWVSDHE